MAKYIATFNDLLGDIEITGFCVVTDKEIERFEELASSITWRFVHPIGDEELEFENGEDFLTRVDFKEISNDEAKTLKKIFDNKFGVFLTEEDLEEIAGIGDEDIDSLGDDDRDSPRFGTEDYDDYN